MPLPRILTGRRRLRFAYLVANGVAQAGVAVGTAMLVRSAFDTLVSPSAAPAVPPIDAALVFGGALTATVLIGAWLRWRSHVDAEHLGQSYVHSVRMTLFRHVARIGADGARRMSRGAIVLRFVGDLSALRMWVSYGLARLTVSGIAAFLAIGALSLVEPVVAIAVGIAVAVSAGLALAIGPRLRVTERESRQRRGQLAAMLNDRVSNVGVMEAFGQERREQQRFGKLSQRLRHSLIDRARVIGLLRALSEASASFASMCALFVGAIQVAVGQASPGAVVAAMVVAGLLAPRLQDLGRVYEFWNGALIAREKQERLLALPSVRRPMSHSDGGDPLADGPGRIELDDVALDPIFDRISMTVEPGSRVAVIGPNGAGKSTLLRLIAGIIHPDSGQVRLDGQDVTTVNWVDLRNAFALVSPSLPLLRGSLRLNLTYGAADKPSDEEIAEVLKQVGLEQLVDRMPKGLDTRVAESGSGLSTGEAARVTLARALLARPRVLLLDEADANLDSSAGEALERVADSFGGTVVYITHNPALAARADHVFELEDGRVTAIDPQELSDRADRSAAQGRRPQLRVVSGGTNPEREVKTTGEIKCSISA